MHLYITVSGNSALRMFDYYCQFEKLLITFQIFEELTSHHFQSLVSRKMATEQVII